MKAQKTHLEGLFALFILGVFAVCLLIILLTGADTYRRLTERDQAAYGRRTCAQYIMMKVRQNDRAGDIFTEPFGGGDALVMRENIDGKTYLTRIYVFEGYLTELFAPEGSAHSPWAGEKIMEYGSLEFSEENGLLSINCTDADGGKDHIVLALRSGEGASE